MALGDTTGSNARHQQHMVQVISGLCENRCDSGLLWKVLGQPQMLSTVTCTTVLLEIANKSFTSCICFFGFVQKTRGPPVFATIKCP